MQRAFPSQRAVKGPARLFSRIPSRTFPSLNKRKLLFSLNGFYRWSVAFLEKTGYPDGEVNSMNKERLGTFIAENRKAFGMTQKDLAETLHITDKAVSKWERGLSYPDVTLL